MKPTNRVFSARGTTIFTVMSALAADKGAINLGQGFPDGEGPDDIRAKAADAILEGPNQYPPSAGLPVLRQAVAAANDRFYGLSVDWENEVLVTSGATEALADSLFGLLEPGDEAILFEPYYDSYLPIVEAAGAKAVPVALQPPDWHLPAEALEAAFSDRTKLIVLNSPMNPTGKVFSREELQTIADLLSAHDAYAVCDEVYEHLVFDGTAHIPLMTLPGMAERSVRIGSAGKTFSLTGWKIGYVTAPPPLMEAIAKAHQYVTFTTPPALQIAVAYGLGREDACFASLASSLQQKRDRLAEGLQEAGFEVMPCAGTYFITAAIGAVAGGEKDDAFCRRITEEAGVAAIPLSPFYKEPASAPTDYARFCFCKEDAVLDEASGRLKNWAKGRASRAAQ